MKKSRFLLVFLLLLTVLSGSILQSCQSDARNATRIPPTVKKSKKQWQDDALLSLSDLINRNTDVDLNYFKRARIYFDREEYSLALADINEAIDEKDNVGEYFLLRGKVNRELGEIDNALEDAERAEALQQTSPDLYILLADIFQVKNRFRDANRYLVQAMKMAPYDGSAYYVKGMLLARQGDSLASLANLNSAINMNPRLIRAYQQSTVIYLKLLNYGQALAFNNRAIKRFPNNAELYFERGDIYKNLSVIDTALANYRKATSINPKYADAFFQIGALEIGQRGYYSALLAFQSLLILRPDHPQINYLVGYCYERLRNDVKAKEYFTYENEKNPADQMAINGLWRIRQRENGRLFPEYYSDEGIDQDYKTLDSSRVKIDLIKPRGTINMRIDSSRNAKIQ
ncbi:tetratricopeptide repeat protein [Dyadobacter subterraneus]|uniref:Tetratricopeptide repeat protein n=1 Tax=Dyadobacter subterraneus TaxID=2773304 RepID=A0ABR9WBR3_9BACT|nr:tetratricopeptide repeat protein [Dyadobacter subterraneus]MBE9462421.1 tetratricopeptide repeat protein [Dyadobacter subterraneus]